jgi:glycine/D-amino acid oxidase-like deaminating enzyme/nitrite reductase/ring-hydroxylating ferredoxin subunit
LSHDGVRFHDLAGLLLGTPIALLSAMSSTGALWQDFPVTRNFPQLADDDLHVDVAIVGGGITGLTSAYLLKRRGLTVAVLEARHLLDGVTGGTTAHLTQVVDGRYYKIEQKFGAAAARLVADSTRDAIAQVETIVNAENLSCSFERLPGFLFAEKSDEVEELGLEHEAALRAGLPTEQAAPPLPFAVKDATRFLNQAQLHPRAYLLPLAQGIPGGGSHVFEGTRVSTVDEGDPCRLHTSHGATITAGKVILATHAPLNRVLLQTKLAHYRSYVVAGPIQHSPYGLFWDLANPYHYIRSQRMGDEYHLVVGGEDHKTGQEPDPNAKFDKLAEYATRFGVSDITHRWSAQVIEPVDGLPFIGLNANSERVFVATGFSGDGMTFGTLSAMILTDACLELPNRYANLYQATRIKPLASLGSYLGENIDFPMHLLSDSLRPPDALSVEEIERGEGKIVRVRGERLAVYRDDDGALHAVSPVCTHLGCHVVFNASEKSWDCPCHGSRFDVDGTVLNAPATRGLQRRNAF